MRKRLGKILIQAGLLTPQRLEECLDLQRTQGKRLGQILVELGYASELDIALSLARQCKFSFVDMDRVVVDPAALALVPEELARQH